MLILSSVTDLLLLMLKNEPKLANALVSHRNNLNKNACNKNNRKHFSELCITFESL